MPEPVPTPIPSLQPGNDPPQGGAPRPPGCVVYGTCRVCQRRVWVLADPDPERGLCLDCWRLPLRS